MRTFVHSTEVLQAELTMKNGIIYIGAFLLFVSPVLSAQPENAPAKNITLFDYIEPITNEEAGGLHNSCWGYVAPDGREYAFLGTQIATYIFDITEKPLRQVGVIAGPTSPWRNIKVYKNYAYISTENRNTEQGAGLQIVDLSGLPDTAALIRTDTNTFISAHTLWIADHYLYAMGTRAEAEVNGGAVILDLEPDPEHPRRVGGVDPYYYHDAFVRNDTLVGAAINGNGVDLYDVSNKEKPQHIATITYPFSGTHNCELLTDGRYVVTSDEVGFTPKTLKVWDISDPDDIMKVAEYTPNIVETIHNTRVRGRYAYVAWYTAGVRIIDLIDPLHPREVGFFDTYQGRDGGLSGVWEVFPHFPSGKIAASDRNSGLYILEFNRARAGSVSGVVQDALTGDPIPYATITLAANKDPASTDAAGHYYIGAILGEEIRGTVSSFGYRSVSFSETIDGDIEQDIVLDPIPSKTFRLVAIDEESGTRINDFSYTVDPYIDPVVIEGESTEISLPIGPTFSLVVGKWGYRIRRMTITVDENTEEIVARLQTGYQDDATLDLGWSYESSEDNATTGRWNQIRPYLGYPNSDWVHPPTDPAGTDSRIFFTGQPPLFAPPDQNDVNNGRTTLTSPLMDLQGYGDPIVLFDRWFVHFERDTILDSLVIELSNDNGRSWVESYSEVKGTAGWKRGIIFPRDHLSLSNEMRIRFRVSDTLGNILVVSGIDNFEVVDRLFSGVDDKKGESNTARGLRLTIHPNPAHDETLLQITGTGELTRVELINSLGRTISVPFEGILAPGDHQVPLRSDLHPGWYVVRGVAGNQIAVERLIVQ